MNPLPLVPAPYADGAWPSPAGYLHGYLDNRLPGYKAFTADASPYALSSILRPGDEVLSVLAALDGNSWGHVNGQTQTDASNFTWNDRLGMALGYYAPPSTAITEWAQGYSPLYLPYLGAVVEQTEVRRESHHSNDRLGRTVLRTWGAARLWRVRITFAGHVSPVLGYYQRGGMVAVQPDGGTRLVGSIQHASISWGGEHRSLAYLTLILSETPS